MSSRVKSAVVITVGTDSVASSRVRGGSLVAQLSASGWKVRRISAGQRRWPAEAALAALTLRPTLIVLQKISAPRPFVRFLRSRTPWLAYEIDDAIYLGYPGTESSATEPSRRISYVISLADRVVTSNHLIASDIAPWTRGIGITHVFPGPAPQLRNFATEAKAERRVLWLGSPSTYRYFIEECAPVCTALSDDGFEIAVVGAPANPTPLDRVSQYQWTEDTETRELEAAKIGVMPMSTDDWAMRKAAYKVLEYLASDIVPVYVRSAAVDTLLGDSQAHLGIALEDGSRGRWIDGVRRATEIKVDGQWKAARDAVFKKWSRDRFATQFLPTKGGESL